MIVAKGSEVTVRYGQIDVRGKVLSVRAGMAIVEMFLFGMGRFFITRPVSEIW